MPLLVAIALILWAVFGEPSSTIAGWFWSKSAAPWEDVDAFYYPNRRDLSKFKAIYKIGSVDACRAWVQLKANAYGHPKLQQSDYECGVGKLAEKSRNFGLNVYRITVR